MRARDRIAQALVATVVGFAALAIGGADRWVIIACAVLAAAAAATALTSQREMTAVSPLLAFLGLAALLTLLQIVPLPAALVAHLSPAKYDLVVANAQALGDSAPSWIPLSLDPPATLLELTKLVAYIAIAYTSSRLAASPQGRRWLVAAVAILVIAVAVITVIHRIVGATRVFGFYTPRQPGQTPFVGPLLNKNHLAALMALGAPLALGLAISSDGHRRMGWIAGALLCIAVNLLAESREGTGGLIAGAVVFGVLIAMQRRHGVRQVTSLRRSDAIAIAIATICGLVLLGALTAGGLARELAATHKGELTGDTGKFAAWRSGAPLLDAYPWTGIGRGAFEVAVTRVSDARQNVYTKVENEYLQAAIDWGFVGAAIVALAFVWLATTVFRRGRSGPWEAGAVAGLVALAFENVADFSLWMPGIAFPAVVTCAAMAFVPVGVTPRKARTWWRPVRAAALAVIAAVIALAASPVGRQTRQETDDLAASFRGRTDPVIAIARGRAVFERHPSDFVAAGLTAEALFAARDRRAVAVANRALDLHPTNADLHRLIGAMLLASQRRDQAVVEYALALRYGLRDALLDEVLARFPDDAYAVRALPLDPQLVKEIADRITQRRRVSLTVAYLQRYLSLYPDDARIQLYTADVGLGTGDQELAYRSAARAHELDTTDRSAVMLARALRMRGDVPAAAAVLETAQKEKPRQVPDRIELLMVLADVQAVLGNPDKARATLHAALELARGREAVPVHRKLAEIEAVLGNLHQADWERKRADELDR